MKHFYPVLLAFVGTMLIWATAPAAEIELMVGGEAPQYIQVPVDISHDAQGNTVVSCEEAASLARTGQPDIPAKSLTVLLPRHVRPDTVQAELTSVVWSTMGMDIEILPVPPAATRDENGQEIIEWPADRDIVDGYDMGVYDADAFFPDMKPELSPVGQMRQYNLVSVTIPLARYNPVTGQLDVLESAQVTVRYQQRSAKGDRLVQKNQRRPARFARKAVGDLAVNFTAAAGDYETTAEGDTEIMSPSAAGEMEGQAADAAAETTGYAIITTNYIVNNSTKLDDFVAHKELLYYDVQVVTETDYGSGTGDTAANNIRAWLQSHYITDNIEYVLIIGNPDPDSSIAPMKLVYTLNQPVTNKVNSYPTDFYFADLTGNWDLDGDGYYGEISVDPGETDDYETGGVDRYYEVVVGRIPYYGSITDLDTILQRTMTYDLQAEGIEWRKNCLLPMKPLDDSTPSWGLGEYIKTNLLIPKGWGYYRLYDTEISYPPSSYEETPCSATGTSVEWGADPYGLVVWQTHGSATSASSVFSTESTYMNRLNPNYPSFTFQASCSNAESEVSTNLAYSLLKKACVSTIGASRMVYYSGGRPNYTSNADIGGFAYQYARNLVYREMTAGQSLATLRQEMDFDGSITFWRHTMAFNVFGDPSLSFAPKYLPIITPPSGKYYPSVTAEVYLPGTGWTIHYTTDGSAPDQSDPVYTGPVTFTSDTIFKVRGYKTSTTYSAIATAEYDIIPGEMFVDDNAPNDPGAGDPLVSDPLEDGSSAHPFDAIQEAVDLAVSGVTITVSPGTYTGTGNRNIDFNGKNIILRSTDPTNPQVVAATVIDCENLGRGLLLDNAESSATQVQGLTITNGYTSSGGGGIYCVNSSPLIENCRVVNCTAGTHGGGLFLDNGAATLRYNVIRGCTTTYGGGIYAKGNAHPTVLNCVLADNTAGSGAAVCAVSATMTFEQVTLANNAASSFGGMVYAMTGNLSWLNCIVWGNTSPTGATAYLTSSSIAAFDYCDVQGGASGFYLNGTGNSYALSPGCYDMAPLFADAANGDYHLQSAAGRWNEAANDWVTDTQTSPVIDTAHPSQGIGEEPAEPANVRKNLGAYGGTAQASRTPEGWSLLCDVNNDGIVDLAEFTLVASQWQQSGEAPAGDYDGDGEVIYPDLLMLCEEWLGTTGWMVP